MRIVDGHVFKPHQAISSHLQATPGPPVFIGLSLLSALAPMRWRTACRCPHAAADRAMRWRRVAEVFMRRRTVTARVLQGPWWRKCRFYPPANPCPTFLFLFLFFCFLKIKWKNPFSIVVTCQHLRRALSSLSGQSME